VLGGARLLAVLALLVGPDGNAQTKKRARALPADLKLVPGDAEAFLTVRVADLLASPVVSKLLPAFGKEAEHDLMLNELPVPPKTVERVTLVLPRNTRSPVLIVRTLEPYDRAAVLGKDHVWTKSEIKGRALYTKEKHGSALHFVDARTLLQGDVKAITALLDAPAKGAGPGPLAASRAIAAGKHHVVLALRPELSTWFLLARPQRMEKKGKAIGEADTVPEKRIEPPREPKKPEKKEGELPPPKPPLPPEPAIALPPLKEAPGPKPEELIEELTPEDVPPELLPFKPLLLARSITMTLDLGMEIKVGARLVYADEDTARDGVVALKSALYVAREGLKLALREEGLDVGEKTVLGPIVKKAQASLRAAEVKRTRSVVRASASYKVDRVALTNVAEEIKKAAERARHTNNLKQLALAMHLFASAHRDRLPAPAIYGKDGKALLSWRVALLPYIEQAPLYREFRLDEPWDSAHNKKLLAKMPKLFAPPMGVKTRQPHSTFYRVFTGTNTVFPEPAVKVPGGPSPGTTISAIFDGTSNTLLIVEAAEAVPWTKPEELPNDAKALPKLGAALPDRFYAAMADGSVYAFKKAIPEKMLRPMITINDGIYVDWDSWVIGGGRRSRPAEKERPRPPEKGELPKEPAPKR
jgi:hypothetical protein